MLGFPASLLKLGKQLVAVMDPSCIVIEGDVLAKHHQCRCKALRKGSAFEWTFPAETNVRRHNLAINSIVPHCRGMLCVLGKKMRNTNDMYGAHVDLRAF